MRKLALPLLIFALIPAASAEVYRWVDAQGQVHYSDAPPPAGAKSTRSIQTPEAATAPAADTTKPKTIQEKEMEFRKRQAEQAEAQKKKDQEAAQAQEKQKNCETARRTLQGLESGQRSATVNEKGERIVMDDAARNAAIAQARKAVDTWCK